MTQQQKIEVQDLVKAAHAKFGSDDKVGVRCDVSGASINLIRNGKWEGVRDGVWTKVAAALGWTPAGWQIVPVTNTRMLHQVFNDAKTASLFMAVSHRAGSGKTASSKAYTSETISGVYLLQCREWSKREFLLNLCRALSIDPGRGYVSGDDMTIKVINFFQQRKRFKPLLIIDEADKLRPAALRSLIPIYNELEEQLGMVIMGTDNLEKEIKRGVRFDKKGFDEIDSRFGRNFIHLIGATAKDVAEICTANGITDTMMHKAIFEECEPRQIMVANRPHVVVEDLRRVKRAVQRELLRAVEVE